MNCGIAWHVEKHGGLISISDLSKVVLFVRNAEIVKTSLRIPQEANDASLKMAACMSWMIRDRAVTFLFVFSQQ